MRFDRKTAAPPAATLGRQPSLLVRAKHSEHARGLLIIGLFKLTKATLSVSLGVGALRLLHKDVADVALRALDALRIDPESRFVAMVMNRADVINSHDLRRFSIVTFCYALVCLVEGTGLMLERRWAEYFTVTLTAAALPWDCYELTNRFTVVRVVLVVGNLLVLAYLVWLLRRNARARESAEGERQPVD